MAAGGAAGGKKPAWVVEKERGERREARETVWLFGLHAVRDALMNPRREKLRLVVTKNALDKLEAAVAASGMAPEVVEPRRFDVPIDEVSFVCAGINHQAFFLEFRRGEQDLYPLIRAALQREEVFGQEPVRGELMRHFGYFVTESSGHASEYLPYFRKTGRQVLDELAPRFKNAEDGWFDIGRTGGYLRHCLEREAHADRDFQALIDGTRTLGAARTHEYGAAILEAIETNVPIKINGNLPNRGHVTNLPPGCCVEVPCLVDRNGVQGVVVGALPPQLAALNRTNIHVQELAVLGALRGDRDAVHHAVLLDPLTAAACSLDQIHALVDEMFAAQARWLPQFAR
jgi:alpha-galactosidase